ncbi:hypothetical protein B0H17DRAFT_1207429 [Mycena rosella]|uniref:Uncharacterized protein n=1 Tax=Mycena rosella TaxID=1033263 RepID=A0AAD7D342_MYCRO|nr:hypothetical protein B0H17DRAFT_1207429 [Mycena rosella]
MSLAIFLTRLRRKAGHNCRRAVERAEARWWWSDTKLAGDISKQDITFYAGGDASRLMCTWSRRLRLIAAICRLPTILRPFSGLAQDCTDSVLRSPLVVYLFDAERDINRVLPAADGQDIALAAGTIVSSALLPTKRYQPVIVPWPKTVLMSSSFPTKFFWSKGGASAGAAGLAFQDFAAINGIHADNQARALRFLSTRHVFPEVAPNTLLVKTKALGDIKAE